MILEIAEIEVKPSTEAAFEAGVAAAAPLFRAANGCRGLELHRSVEFPGRYRLFVRWDRGEGEHEEFGERDTLDQEKRPVSAEYP